jgi:hypothetical protein
LRASARAVIPLGLLVFLAGNSKAGDGEPAAIINKALKAHFPKGQDPKSLGMRAKTKGTLHIMGQDVDFTQEVAVQIPNKLKDVMALTLMNKTFTVTTVFNGKEGWIKAGDKDQKVTPEILAELKEAAYLLGLMQGLFLKEKGLKLSLLGEVQVRGKPALGLTVAKEGKKDVNLYFDKKTGLIAKVEMRKRDLMTGQEITEERIITEYREVAGRKVARKAEIVRDGRPFLEAEITDVQFLDTVPDSEFVQPQ